MLSGEIREKIARVLNANEYRGLTNWQVYRGCIFVAGDDEWVSDLQALVLAVQFLVADEPAAAVARLNGAAVRGG